MSDLEREREATCEFARIVAATLKTHPDVHGAQASDDQVSGSFKGSFDFFMKIEVRTDPDAFDDCA